MEKEFVPKKTITVQLTLEMHEKFNRLCKELGLPKTKVFERLIQEAHNALFGE